MSDDAHSFMKYESFIFPHLISYHALYDFLFLLLFWSSYEKVNFYILISIAAFVDQLINDIDVVCVTVDEMYSGLLAF